LRKPPVNLTIPLKGKTTMEYLRSNQADAACVSKHLNSHMVKNRLVL
jgi:hypothetical protein